MTALMYEGRTAEHPAATSTIDEPQPPTSPFADRIDALHPLTAADDTCDGNCSYCWGPETD
jgi:hypothetical protein